MRMDAIRSISPRTPGPDSLIALEQHPARLSGLATLLFVVPACIALLTPFAFVAAVAAGQPDLLDTVADKPVSALQLLAALICVVLVLAFTIRRAARNLGRGAIVEIGHAHVHVEEHSLTGSRRWREPLCAYYGLARHIRATMSGVRHELVLVHRDSGRSVLIHIAPSLEPSRVAELSELLRVAEVPARLLYDAQPRMPVTAVPALAASTA